MSYECIDCQIENHVATVTINRPPVNALNKQVFNEINQLMDELEDCQSVKAVIITGGGKKAFVAGLDLQQVVDLDIVEMMQLSKLSGAAFSKIENLSKPVIAAINGIALGGGLELALACDLRICSEQVKFAMPEINLAIIPGGGGTQRLQKIVGQGKAKEILYFGEMFDASKALEFQLVNKVVPEEALVATAKEWAEKLANKPTVAMRMLKTAVTAGANSDLGMGLTLESACYSNTFATEDRIEGMQAFLEKRKPVYVGK
ncbi:enoyl-CoA hydratase/isomerase family protein [Alkalihalobacillus deserti]|uniref:enoyl-CoA hydratase/isomerase family protein n=1 Tax=Alkalihalobacillus deserti TaxID=2879466 RepID=UPI001D143216|nr:enoyl-CoA hydratase-related protein [Alkalihalobacillus deserti]